MTVSFLKELFGCRMLSLASFARSQLKPKTLNYQVVIYFVCAVCRTLFGLIFTTFASKQTPIR